MDEYEKRKRSVIIGGFILLVAVIAFVIVSLINHLKYNATFNFLVVPSFTTIELDGKTYKNQGTIKLEPGDYTAILSAEGFTTQEIPVTLSKNQTTDLYVYLIPKDGSMDWYAAHPSEGMLLNTIGNYNAQKDAVAYLEKYPVSAILPIIKVETTPKWLEYRIDGGKFDECKNDFCIKITDTTGGNRDRAIKDIQDKGYNPNDYEIVYEYKPIEPIPQSTVDKIHQQYGV